MLRPELTAQVYAADLGLSGAETDLRVNLGDAEIRYAPSLLLLQTPTPTPTPTPTQVSGCCTRCSVDGLSRRHARGDENVVSRQVASK